MCRSRVRSRASSRSALFALLLMGALLVPRSAEAGCGCEKPPPPPAQVRPNVTFAGTPVTLFAAGLVEGTPYTVTFTSGVTDAEQSVETTVVVRRDLADGIEKPQLVVDLPVLPLGPTSIQARRTGQAVVDLVIDDADFTVAPSPVALPTAYGSWQYPDFQAAVSRDGVVYFAIDLTGIHSPAIFEAQAVGYPLRFTAQDVVFKNVQGFLMQLLMQGEPDAREPVPGMFIFPSSSPATSSDMLHYSRHEFTTYFLQHAERKPHAIDPTDANWHLDGTPHIDHDYLILSIMGRLNDGSLPTPGATPAFQLVTRTYSLFYQGLVGKDSIAMKGDSRTDGFGGDDSESDGGDLLSNGPVTIADKAVVKGDITATHFTVWSNAKVTGALVPNKFPQSFMEVKLPSGLPYLGDIRAGSSSLLGNLLATVDIGGRPTIALQGPGSFQVDDLVLTNKGTLFIDNSEGPVTLYVTGGVSLSGQAEIEVANPDPEQFAIYVTGTDPVTLQGDMTFFGVLYAPTSSVKISGSTEFYGAFVGASMATSQQARVHYYRPLRGE